LNTFVTDANDDAGSEILVSWSVSTDTTLASYGYPDLVIE